MTSAGRRALFQAPLKPRAVRAPQRPTATRASRRALPSCFLQRKHAFLLLSISSGTDSPDPAQAQHQVSDKALTVLPPVSWIRNRQGSPSAQLFLEQCEAAGIIRAARRPFSPFLSRTACSEDCATNLKLPDRIRNATPGILVFFTLPRPPIYTHFPAASILRTGVLRGCLLAAQTGGHFQGRTDHADALRRREVQ